MTTVDASSSDSEMPLRLSCLACTAARKRCVPSETGGPCSRCVKFECECLFVKQKRRGPPKGTRPPSSKAASRQASLAIATSDASSDADPLPATSQRQRQRQRKSGAARRSSVSSPTNSRPRRQSTKTAAGCLEPGLEVADDSNTAVVVADNSNAPAAGAESVPLLNFPKAAFLGLPSPSMSFESSTRTPDLAAQDLMMSPASLGYGSPLLQQQQIFYNNLPQLYANTNNMFIVDPATTLAAAVPSQEPQFINAATSNMFAWPAAPAAASSAGATFLPRFAPPQPMIFFNPNQDNEQGSNMMYGYPTFMPTPQMEPAQGLPLQFAGLPDFATAPAAANTSALTLDLSSLLAPNLRWQDDDDLLAENQSDLILSTTNAMPTPSSTIEHNSPTLTVVPTIDLPKSAFFVGAEDSMSSIGSSSTLYSGGLWPENQQVVGPLLTMAEAQAIAQGLAAKGHSLDGFAFLKSSIDAGFLGGSVGSEF